MEDNQVNRNFQRETAISQLSSIKIESLNFGIQDHGSSSLERIRFNSKERKSNLETSNATNESSTKKIVPSESVNYCKNHPDEDLQFYSLTNNQYFCSECLLSGGFVGNEIINLKKVAEKIKPRFDELIQGIIDKATRLNQTIEALQKNKEEVNNFILNFRETTKEKFYYVRAALDKKEKEILESLSALKSTKETEIESRCNEIKENLNEILGMKVALENNWNELKGADLFKYYLNKSKTAEKLISEKFDTRFQDLTTIDPIEEIKAQYNLIDTHYEINNLLENINTLKGLEQNHKITEIFLFKKRDNFEKRNVQNHAPENAYIETENKKIVHPIEKSVNYLNEHTTSSLLPSGNETGIFSPLSITANSNSIKLVDKINEAKRAPNPIREIKEFKKDARSSSISKINMQENQFTLKLNQLEKGKEGLINIWENYTSLTQDTNRKRRNLTASTTKLEEQLEKTKITPKSYVPDFTMSQQEPNISPSKKELVGSVSAQWFSGAKNGKSFIQDELLRQPNISLKLQARRTDDNFHASNLNRSFGSTSLSTNLRTLKKQMGFWNDE